MSQSDTPARTDDGGLRVYALILAVAVVLGVGVLLYVAAYRQEIVAIVTQSPT